MKKIVVIGVESTGKSQLCQALAEHYQSVWVQEYARDYLSQYGTEYDFDDLLLIAQGQIRLEDEALQQAQIKEFPFVFVDTDLQVIHIWSDVVFGQSHDWVEQQRAARTCDLYLLTCPDLPWVSDGMREVPDLQQRQRLHQRYEELLKQQPAPWAYVSGVGLERTLSAIKTIQQFNLS